METTTPRDSSTRQGRGRRRANRAVPKTSQRYSVQSPYCFDTEAADLACDFFPRFLRHSKGEWRGQPFELERWQRDEIIRPLFGWKQRADGLRRYREVFVYLPRKNGKSALAAGIALYLLYCDGEGGAEIYSVAGDRFQAGIVFNQASEMVKASPELLARTEVYKRSLFVPESASVYQVLSADVPTKHGLSPHGILFDELHVQDDRDMWDTMSTGRGARRQPVTIAMTTAGYDKNTICGQMYDRAVAIRDGAAVDDAFLPVIYGAGEKDDWTDPGVWGRANPNLGVSIQPTYLEREFQKAKDSPPYQNTFRRLHLNQWVTQVVRWIDQRRWDACAGELSWQEMWPALRGRQCFAGLDLSTVTDLSALVLLFDSSVEAGAPDYPTEESIDAGVDLPKIPGWEYGDPLPSYDMLCRFWCPGDGIVTRSKRDRVSYEAWRDQGALTATHGDAVDHGAIRKAIVDINREYPIREVAADPYNAHKLLTELEEEDGLTVVRMSQGFGSMSPPTKALDALYRRGQVRHGGQPVLAWCASNAALDKDAYDNWKPSKKRSRERIDGIVAAVMALARAQVSTGAIEDGRIESL